MEQWLKDDERLDYLLAEDLRIIVAEHCRRERVEKRYLSMLRGE